MRLLSAAILFVLVSVAATAQIVVDLRPHPPMPPSPRPHRMAPLTLDRHTVTVKIEDGLATTTVKQTFRNPNAVALEGTYVFPLAEDAAIGGFAMLMGGKMVSGEVLEKQKAAQIYRDIVARSLDPALLEYVGRRLFQARVFPIPARGTTDVEMTFSETLSRSASLLEYRYPFRTDGVSPYPVGEAVVAMEVTSKTPMRAIYSPSHKVDVVKKGDFEAKVSFEQKGYTADRDFVLALGLGADPIGATLLSHVEQGGEGAFVLVLAPSIEVKAAKSVPKDVIFVADTSGSMAGEKIEQLRRALSFCLKNLNDGDRFGLITFSTEARLFAEKMQPVDKTSIADALRYVSEIKAVGGTNIHAALAQALALDTDAGTRPVNVIFLTDGLPTVGTTDVDTILKSVSEKNKAVQRVFVFGIGKDLNPVLLDRLAEENRGARDYVDEREDIEVKVSGFYEKIANPILSGAKVTFEGVAVEDVYPKTLPDLFRGSQLLLTGRFKGEGELKVHLSGMVESANVTHTFAMKIGGASKHPSVPRLWAVRKVGYLLDQIRLNGEQKELKDEIVRLGTKHGIVTPYTSFLVLEDAPVAGGERRSGRSMRRLGGDRDAPDRGAGSAPSLNPPAADEALLKLSAEEAAALPGPIGLGSGSGSGGAKANVERERAKEDVELKDKYFSDSITLSQHIKQLRDAQAGSGGAGGTVKLAGDRTFIARFGLYVDSAVLAMDPAAIESKLKKIEAYSDAYFDLLAASPHLAPVLALGENVLFADGGVVYQIVPKAAAESRPAEGTESR